MNKISKFTVKIPRKISGFSLLEVLIALLILSIGLLGIAGLQVTSKRANFEAIQRTTATMLARDMLERIRANSGELDTYTNGTSGQTFTLTTAPSAASPDCGTTACTTAQIVAYDLAEWQRAIAGVAELSGGNNSGGLVAPVACITVPGGAPNGTVNVAIAWRGLVKLGDPIINTCGNASGLYGDGATANVFRRVIEVETFIN